MKSLYEQNPTHWDKLAENDRKNLREMAKHFSRAFQMDRALGLIGAASHWHAGRNGAFKTSDLLAADWLEKNVNNDKPSVEDPLVEATANFEGTRMLLIVATPDQAAKIEKIAALIGAEVTDV